MAVVMLWLKPPCPGVLLETCGYGKMSTGVEGGTASEPPEKIETAVEELIKEDQHLNLSLIKYLVHNTCESLKPTPKSFKILIT